VAVSVQHVPAVVAAEGSSKVTGGSGAFVANRAVVAKKGCTRSGCSHLNINPENLLGGKLKE
jgi:hypothetical protein